MSRLQYAAQGNGGPPSREDRIVQAEGSGLLRTQDRAGARTFGRHKDDVAAIYDPVHRAAASS
jgi:hypothetical protein